MSTKINDGGLAFPGTRWQQVGTVADHGFSDDDTPTFDHVTHPGMSLRDWFAGQAMAGLYAGRGGQAIQERHFGEDARLAYAAADAMIAAREAGEQ